MQESDLPKRYSPSGQVLKGGQGDVHLCNDSNLERTVAIKFVQDVKDMPRLLDEILALQGLRSDYVVEVYDIVPVDSDTEIGLVEEYIDGEDLYAAFDDGGEFKPPQIDIFLKLIYQIACGISDIHESGIVHRDIKLNNMKISKDGRVKIFDFGLAKIVNKDAETKGFKGTFSYAAPELYVEGDSTVVIGPAVDVYAFGISAWLLATFDLPSDLNQIPPHELTESIIDSRKDIPPEVADIIDQCLKHDPDDRPDIQSVVDIISARLTYGRHKGLLTSSFKSYQVDQGSKGINIDLGAKGRVEIRYDGYSFYITPVSGDIVVNNQLLNKREKLPGASVIAFGDPDVPHRRTFMTFDVSHPEVIL